ncbi:MAG: hypothetical protein ACREPD_10965 [Stenotrophomonas sp.]|uniref:hypothetical protein n=1 Tax=Stenotrophomonas sp. TaxID=69392 RepID=UPI003D6D373F
MTILISIFVLVLVLLCYVAVTARTTNRRVLAVVGIFLLQFITFVWIQVLARAASSVVDQGLQAMSAGAFFYQIRPLLGLSILVCAALVIVTFCTRKPAVVEDAVEPERYSITLRVIHPHRRHEEIAAVVDLKLVHGQTAGEPRKSNRGETLGGAYKETIAAFALSDRVEGHFVDGVRNAVELIQVRREYLRDVVKSGGRLMLYIGVFVDDHVGFSLDRALLGALSSLDVELGVEVYAG